MTLMARHSRELTLSPGDEGVERRVLLIENSRFCAEMLVRELRERLQLEILVAQTLAAEGRFEQLREAIGQLRIPFREYVIAITASIGVCHRADRDVHSLPGDADRLLYLSKATGRNRVEFNSWSASR